MKQPSSLATPSDLWPLLGVAALYTFTGLLVNQYFVINGRASLFYLASGVALAAVLMGGPRFFWAVFLGALVKGLAGGVVWWGAMGSALGSALAALVGAWLVRRQGHFNTDLPSLRDVWRVVIWGAAVACVISAVIGSMTLLLRDVVSAEDVFQSMVFWWMGDMFGVVLLAPLLLVWWPVVRQRQPRPSNGQLAEAALIFSLTALAGSVVFLDLRFSGLPTTLHLAMDEVPQGYWMFLFVAWVALRLGQRGTTLVLLLIASVAAVGIAQGTGYFRNSVSLSHMTGYWFYTVILVMVGLALSTYVTATKRAVERLARSEAKITLQYTNALAALDQHAIVATADVQGRILSVNDKFCEISGYAREELLGQDHAMLNSGVHPKGFFKEMYRSVASGRAWHAEVCNRGKDGHLYWVQTTVTPVMGKDGKPTLYIAIRTDITGRKETEAFLEQIVARVPGCLYQFKMHGNGHFSAPYASEGLLALYGLTPEQVRTDASGIFAAVHPEDQAVFSESIQQSARELRLWKQEYRIIHPASGIRWISGNAMPQRGENGVVLWHGFVTDITARKEVDAELMQHRNHLEELVAQKSAEVKASQDRFQLAVESADEGVWDLNLLTGEVYNSPRMWEMLGYTADEMPTRYAAWEAITDPNDMALFLTEMRAHFKNAAHEFEVLLRLRARDGDWRWILSRGKAGRNEAGRAIRFTGTHQDITERKQAEEAAHAANRSKSEFLANMSHEIRTPMNGVIGVVDILQQTVLLPEQARMLDTIHSSSMALLSILNDILDFSKIEAGKLEVESIPTNLREVTEDVAQLMLNVASAKDAQISLFVDPALPTWVLSDPTRLRQVLFNLMGNALKFVPTGAGRAMLHVQPTVRQDGVACVQFAVIDNGIGMSAEVVAKLFQPFTQADASTARRFGGSGLGLSITQRLVEMMHGRVSVSSTPNVGSEFLVEFPLVEASAPDGRTSCPTPDLRGVRVLAVSSVSASSTLIQVYLGAAGAQVRVVPDLAGAQAELAHMPQAAQAPGDTVLLLDQDDEGNPTLPADACALAAGVRVVRLVSRMHSQVPVPDGQPHEIRVLARPLLRHDLIHAVAVAGGRERATETESETVQGLDRRRWPRLNAPSVQEAAQAGRLILIAEDNETNRDVMREQLRLLGYACEVGQDGELALAMWQSQPDRYALLLTDCHMPYMDGFELTEAIRQAEPIGSRLPIVAITANAMQGEADRCRERGMDDYLSKPLRLNELGSMLARWMPQTRSSPASLEPAQKPRDQPASDILAIWDPHTLTGLVGDNPAMHKRLLGKFLLNATEQVATLAAAIAAGNTQAAAGVAHTLKSSARSVGALALGELCQGIETAGHKGDAPACTALAKDLAGTFAAAELAINQD